MTSLGEIRVAAGLSIELESRSACARAVESARKRLQGRHADLAVAFFSPHHSPHAGEIASIIHDRLKPRCLIGVSAYGVIGGRLELERSPGLSILAASLPGVGLHPFSADDLPMGLLDNPDSTSRIASVSGASDSLRAVLLFADPFSVPMVSLLPALNHAVANAEQATSRAFVFGGMASAGREAGENRLLLNDTVHLHGLVGLGISGPVRIDAIVSQGCRGFGPVMVVTKARRNLIMQLGGRPALEVVKDVVSGLTPGEQKHLKAGLFLGIVVNEYKERFGRDDFLVRNVLGIEESSGSIAIGDSARVGQTVRLHMRDAQTAHEDLAMLLDAQQLHDRPAGVMLVTCNGRGTSLFPQPNHDALAIVRAFGRVPGGAESAKIGAEIEPGTGEFPLAGMFAAGEIGPVSGRSYLHGHTACAALFREPETSPP